MSPSAQLAAVDFVRLAGEGALGLYGNKFFATGFGSLPDDCQSRFPALSTWRGVRSLKRSLSQTVCGEDNLPVLLASRTTSLMRLAAQLAAERCKSILTVDTNWPPYHDILEGACSRTGVRLTTVNIRRDILADRLIQEAAIERIVNRFRSNLCDGLFLTAVSNTGIRLPIDAIVRNMVKCRRPRFVVIDGAQDFCHGADENPNELVDLYLAGCHKWLCAYQAMGVAISGRRETQAWIAARVGKLLRAKTVDDPLLRFTQEMEQGTALEFGETVNLAPLISCRGALQDVPTSRSARQRIFGHRLRNANALIEFARDIGWRPLVRQDGLMSGILLLQAIRGKARARAAAQQSDRFRRHGIILTAYRNGFLRLSMSSQAWNGHDFELATKALRDAA